MTHMPIPDLWPEDISDETGLVMPVTILREQAAALTQRTRGIIEAEVRSTKPETSRDGTIVHEFVLIAPALDGYAYALFQVSHPMEGYPVSVYFGPVGQRDVKGANDQESLVSLLRIIFNSAPTKSVIQALLAQSKS